MSLLTQQTGSDLPRLLNWLAQQLTQVLDCAERKVEDAKYQPGQTFKYLGPFQSETYLPQIPDYEIWVPYPQWISLDKIRKRIKGKGDCLYTQASDLISDVHQVQLNAESYNAPGHGQIGNPDLADTARRLFAFVCEGVHAFGKELTETEECIATAMETRSLPMDKPSWLDRPLQTRKGTWRIPEHSEAFLLEPIRRLPPDVFRLLFFTKGKPDGMPCLGVRCRRHAHQGMADGHLVLLDRMQDVMRWFGAHADCRPEWAEFKPDYQAGEKQPAYKQRVGAVLHFSKQAPASRQILYPGEFAAEGREIAAAAQDSGAASAQSGSQTASDQPVQLPIPGAESSDNAEGSPPTFLPPQLNPDWLQGSLSPWSDPAFPQAPEDSFPSPALAQDARPVQGHEPRVPSLPERPAAPEQSTHTEPSMQPSQMQPQPVAPQPAPPASGAHTVALGALREPPKAAPQQQRAPVRPAYASKMLPVAKRPRVEPAEAAGTSTPPWQHLLDTAVRAVPPGKGLQAIMYFTEQMGKVTEAHVGREESKNQSPKLCDQL